MLLLSPSKTVDFTPILPPIACTQPRFGAQAGELITHLKSFSPQSLEKKMRISQREARETHHTLRHFPQSFSLHNAKPALFCYNDRTYSQLNAMEYTGADLAFAQDHLRIVSGLFGCVRPLDLIQPALLKMDTAELVPSPYKTLQDYWKKRLTRYFKDKLIKQNQPALINLAPKAYAKVIDKKELGLPWIDIQFKEERDGALRTVPSQSQKARGMLVDFMVKHRIATPDELQQFHRDGYSFRRGLSSAHTWIFSRPADPTYPTMFWTGQRLYRAPRHL